MRDHIKELPLDKLIEATRHTGGKKIILFGSQVHGTQKKDSDLDVCIIVDNDENTLEYQKEFRLRLWEIGYDWKIPLDIHVYPKDTYHKLLSKNDFFLNEVSKGLTVYG